MFGIGQFAQLAKVSVRTLRHYDQIGLFRPAAVDGSSGYRFYRAAQLPLLNRILVLKDLGLTLAEIDEMLHSGVSNEELIGMLRLRQAETERAAENERRRLSRVAARIDLLEATAMTDIETAIVVKPLDPLHLGTASEPVASFEDEFAPIFDRLYERVYSELDRQALTPAGPNCAFYEERADGRIEVIAGVPIPRDEKVDSPTVATRDLPAVPRAATMVHNGDMAKSAISYQVLQQWIDAAGERPVGFSREVYLECGPDRDNWVTELQFALQKLAIR